MAVSEDERPDEGIWKFWPEAEVCVEWVLMWESSDMPEPSIEENGAGPERR